MLRNTALKYMCGFGKLLCLSQECEHALRMITLFIFRLAHVHRSLPYDMDMYKMLLQALCMFLCSVEGRIGRLP